MTRREITLDDRVLVDVTYRFGTDTFNVNHAFPGTGRGWSVSTSQARDAVLRLANHGELQATGEPLMYRVTRDGFHNAYMLGANHAHSVIVSAGDLKPGDRIALEDGSTDIVNVVFKHGQVRLFGAGLTTFAGPVTCWPIWRVEREIPTLVIESDDHDERRIA